MMILPLDSRNGASRGHGSPIRRPGHQPDHTNRDYVDNFQWDIDEIESNAPDSKSSGRNRPLRLVQTG